MSMYPTAPTGIRVIALLLHTLLLLGLRLSPTCSLRPSTSTMMRLSASSLFKAHNKSQSFSASRRLSLLATTGASSSSDVKETKKEKKRMPVTVLSGKPSTPLPPPPMMMILSHSTFCVSILI